MVDSNYFIALLNKKERHHKRACELYEKIFSQKVRIVPLLFLSEAVASVNDKLGGQMAMDLFDALENDFKIYYPTESDIAESMRYVLRYDGELSLADSLAVYLMKKYDMTYIYSFDSDFDKIEGIVRVY